MKLAALALIPLLSACRFAGNYVGDRALDFVDQYRVAVGAGSVAGVRSQSLGIYDTGLMMGVKPKAAALGLRYGTPLWFDAGDTRLDADQAEIVKTTTVVDLDIGDGSYRSAWDSIAIVPGLLTWADSTPTDFEWEVPEEGGDFVDRSWLWSAASFADNRYAQIHAFDIELGLGLFVYLDLGWSPGEFLDFLLGFVLIDIAQDDGRL